jgi:NAD(P)-dependent dehydrogenase (short-subunit alcohol dehydrogenase family)
MERKTIIVTGASSGLGLEIARQLALGGARVSLACRSEERGRQALRGIEQRTGNEGCELLLVDLSSQASIREAAARFADGHDRLDALVNNAGVNLTARQTSADGVELTLATNVLGYHLLTRLLEPLLAASRPARVVNVASTFAGELDLEDLQFERRRYDGLKAYRQSKQANRMLTREANRLLRDRGVTVNAMAPGLMMTGLFRDATWFQRTFLGALGLFIGRTVEQGADTAVWLASSPQVEGQGGGFYELRELEACQFWDPAAERALWEACEALVGGG